MSLSFLTARNPSDKYTEEAVPPRTDTDQWMRPYHLGPWRVASASLILLLATYLLLASVIIGLAGGVSGAAACAAGAALVIGCALRLLRMGLWVSGQGLRQVGFFYTTTLRRERIGTVRTVQQPVRWLGLPRTVQGQALIVTTRNGQTLRLLMTDHNADFLGRTEAFDLAADALEGCAAELR